MEPDATVDTHRFGKNASSNAGKAREEIALRSTGMKQMFCDYRGYAIRRECSGRSER